MVGTTSHLLGMKRGVLLQDEYRRMSIWKGMLRHGLALVRATRATFDFGLALQENQWPTERETRLGGCNKKDEQVSCLHARGSRLYDRAGAANLAARSIPVGAKHRAHRFAFSRPPALLLLELSQS